MAASLRAWNLVLYTLAALTPSSAQVLVEHFAYPEGDTLITRTWSQTGTVITNPIIVTSPGLRYVDYPSLGNAVSLTTSGQDVNKSFTPQSSGSLYASFLVKVASAQGGDYFFHFIRPPNTSGAFFGRVFVRNANNGFLSFGISKTTTSSTFPPVYSDSVYLPSQTYLIYVKYVFNPGDSTNDQVSLFVFSPPGVPSTEPPVPTVGPLSTTQLDATSLGFVALRQGTSSIAPTVTIDGIRIATTWIGATPTVIWTGEGLDNQWFTPENWDLSRVPSSADSAVTTAGGINGAVASVRALRIPSGILSVTTGLLVSQSVRVDSGGGIIGTAPFSELNVGTDLNLNGSFDVSGASPVITIGRSFLRGPLATFSPGMSTVRFTGTGTMQGNFYNLLIDSTAALTTDRAVVVGSRCEVRGSLSVQGSDTLFITSPDSAACSGSGTLRRGTIRRSIHPTLAQSYWLESNSTFVRFRTPGPVPSSITATVYPDTNPASFGTAWVRVGGTVDTTTHSIVIDSVSRFSLWAIRIPRETDDLLDSTFVRRAYYITTLGDTNFLARISLRYEPSEIPAGIPEDSLQIYRLDAISQAPYESPVLPEMFVLYQNYPNPFNPTTTIRYQIPRQSHVTLNVFDVLGREVATLVDEVKQPGRYERVFNAEGLASGVYVYRLHAGGHLLSRKLMVMK